MVAAWREGGAGIEPRHVVARPHGSARAILRGDPTASYPYVREAVAASGGTFEAVDEAEIAAARDLLLHGEGIVACEASACTVAALRRLVARGTVARHETVLLNVTGGVREGPPPPAHARLVRQASGEWARRAAR
jgi:threonine synthase